MENSQAESMRDNDFWLSSQQLRCLNRHFGFGRETQAKSLTDLAGAEPHRTGSGQQPTDSTAAGRCRRLPERALQRLPRGDSSAARRSASVLGLYSAVEGDVQSS